MSPFLFPLLLLLSLLTTPTSNHQVAIKIHYQHFHRTFATCPHHPPGLCCRAPPLTRSSPALALPGYSISFQHLLPGDIAAVFQTAYRSDLPNAGCSTAVLASGHGPGTFDYTRPGDDEAAGGIGGGSYVGLGGVRIPPDAESVGWLVFEGVLGLVWGGGEWFVDAAARRRSIGGRRMRRETGSERKGTVYVQAPARWVYPAVMEVDGVEYMDGGLGNLAYKDFKGAVLNLTLFDEGPGW